MGRVRSRTWILALGIVTAGAIARGWYARRSRRPRPSGADLVLDDGVALHTESGGPADADMTAVLVHGFAGRLDEFREQLPELGRHVRVVAYDQRGHGRSGWGGRRSATLERLAHDLAAVLEQRTSGPVVLVGHSMGGMVVMALAAHEPDLVRRRVAGVALLSTSSGDLPRAVLPPRLADVLLRTHLAELILVGDWIIAPVLDRLGVARWSAVQHRMHRQVFGERAPTREQVDLVDAMWAGTRRSVTAAFLPALARHDRRDALAVLGDLPTLVLTGDQDLMIPPGHSAVIAEELGEDAHLVVVPDAGHLVNLTFPEVVNPELVHLIERARAAHAGRGEPGEAGRGAP